MSQLPRIVRSLEEFTKIASELRDKWMGKSDMAITPWFRGHENADWGLVPSFYRKSPTDQGIEREMREEFITHAPAFSDASPMNAAIP